MRRHVVIMNWRDTANPEGGGSELFVEHIATGLVGQGHRVTIVCAAHDEAPADEVKNGIRFVRRGSKVSVYAHGWWLAFGRRLGHVDVFIDVQNGLPFFIRTATRVPVIVLVHHVHKEQWPVVYPGVAGRVGWWLESVLAPQLFRSCQYIAVSQATRAELIRIGVRRDRVAVVHNGTEPAPAVTSHRALAPTLCSLGRLVPHKQVEHAIDAVLTLRHSHPELRLLIAGSGWWHDELVDYAKTLGVSDAIEFLGRVSEQDKHEVLAQSWVLVLPSLKEGWGLAIGEAAQHGVPAVAYRAAGGTNESILDGQTGILVDDKAEFVCAIESLLVDDRLRRSLGDRTQASAEEYTWERATLSMEHIIESSIQGLYVGATDPG